MEEVVPVVLVDERVGEGMYSYVLYALYIHEGEIKQEDTIYGDLTYWDIQGEKDALTATGELLDKIRDKTGKKPEIIARIECGVFRDKTLDEALREAKKILMAWQMKDSF